MSHLSVPPWRVLPWTAHRSGPGATGWFYLWPSSRLVSLSLRPWAQCQCSSCKPGSSIVFVLCPLLWFYTAAPNPPPTPPTPWLTSPTLCPVNHLVEKSGKTRTGIELHNMLTTRSLTYYRGISLWSVGFLTRTWTRPWCRPLRSSPFQSSLWVLDVTEPQKDQPQCFQIKLWDILSNKFPWAPLIVSCGCRTTKSTEVQMDVLKPAWGALTSRDVWIETLELFVCLSARLWKKRFSWNLAEGYEMKGSHKMFPQRQRDDLSFCWIPRPIKDSLEAPGFGFQAAQWI